MQKFFYPVRAELRMQKASNKREYQKRLRKINAQVDSMVRATPGHLLFTVSDTGSGMPPLERSPQALVRTWELEGPDGQLFRILRTH